MKKKAGLVSFAIELVLVIAMVFLIVSIVSIAKEDYDIYKMYKGFCEDHPSFCYCSYFTCKFNFQNSVSCKDGISGDKELSEDNQDFCNLANNLNDTKMLFEGECYK